MTTLCIDYGTSHLGLAVAEVMLATPLGELGYRDDNYVFTELGRVVQDHNVKLIVIGLPEGKLVEKIKNFGTRLERALMIPVVYYPETLSTQEAIAALREGGASRAKLKNDHTYAACLILEDYLEAQQT